MIIGTAQFGYHYGIANKSGRTRRNEVHKILDYAWINGIDTIDTAKAYGNSEQIIGDYLNKNPDKTFTVITKLDDLTYKVNHQIQDSVKKLNQLPSIVMAHSADIYLQSSFQRELAEAKNKFGINKIGVSVYNENELFHVMQSFLKPDIVQLPINILDTRLYRGDALDIINREKIEVHARSVFLQGLFYLNEEELNTRFSDVTPYINKLELIAQKANLSLPELSLLWLNKLNKISKIVIGIDNVNQLELHIKSLKKTLKNDIIDQALNIKYENEIILNPSKWPTA